MADNQNTETAAAESKKAKTVAEGFPARRTFANAEEAANFLNKSAADFSDFGDQKFAMAGLDSEGNFDPAIYDDNMRVMVARLQNRGEKQGDGTRAPSTIKAIVVVPAPTLDSLLADDAGRAFVQKIIDKELNHVAVRSLRDADDIDEAMKELPTTREAYISSSRDGGGGIMEAFNALYKSINTTLSAKVKSWDKRRLIKSEIKKAMESTAYAMDNYPELEDRGDKDSLFVTAIKIGQAAAKRQGLDPAIFDKWLATRDSQVLSQTDDEDEDEDDLDVDALADSIGDEAKPTEGEAEATDEAETETADEPAAE